MARRQDTTGTVANRLKRAIAFAASRASVHVRLAAIERRLHEIEHHSHGSRGVYVGNNRLLVKSVVAGSVNAYLVPADDLLLTPWFAVTGQFWISARTSVSFRV